MAVVLSRAGILIPKGKLSADMITKLRKKFTVTHTRYDGGIASMTAHMTDRKSGTLVLARARGFEIMDNGGEKVIPVLGEPVMITGDTQFDAKLEDHQSVLVEHLAKHFTPERIAAGRGYCYLKRKAGRGKTFIALALVARYKYRTLYITHNLQSMEQAAAAAKRLYPHLTVGVWHGKKKTTGDITIAPITAVQDAVLGDMPCTDWFRQFGYVILDETPEYCTGERSKIFMKVQTHMVLAMSATPDERLDGMDRIAFLHFGQPLDGDKLVETTKPPDWKIMSICMSYNGPPQFTEKKLSKLDTVSHPLMVNMFCQDPWRTQLIVDTVVDMVKLGKTVFIMLDRRSYAALLVKLLRTRLDGVITPDRDIQKLLGGATAEEKLAAKNDARVCCVTYRCGGVGLSFPRYDAIVFGHPRRNGFKQFINRVFRLDGDVTKDRRLIFIQDNATPLKTQHSGFKSALKAEYPQTVFSVSTVEYEKLTLNKDVEQECAAFSVES